MLPSAPNGGAPSFNLTDLELGIWGLGLGILTENLELFNLEL
jgi:hypothetical protein